MYVSVGKRLHTLSSQPTLCEPQGFFFFWGGGKGRQHTQPPGPAAVAAAARALTVEVVVELLLSFGHSSLVLLFSDDVEFTMATSATLRFTLRQ